MASKEKLPLAYVAQRHSLGAAFWFADSLLHEQMVYGRAIGAGSHLRLTRDVIKDLTLSPDMSSLKSESSDEPQIIDLRVTPPDLRRYMRWARTFQ